MDLIAADGHSLFNDAEFSSYQRQVMGKHFSPNRPVVGSMLTDIQPVLDVLLKQDAAQPFVIRLANIIISRSQNNSHFPEVGVFFVG